MSDEQEPVYGLVMPFVNVASKGGPYEDDAYCAGWHMGSLDVRLGELKPVELSETIRTAETAQADLLAMKHGYRAEWVPSEVEGWTFIKFIREAVD